MTTAKGSAPIPMPAGKISNQKIKTTMPDAVAVEGSGEVGESVDEMAAAVAKAGAAVVRVVDAIKAK